MRRLVSSGPLSQGMAGRQTAIGDDLVEHTCKAQAREARVHFHHKALACIRIYNVQHVALTATGYCIRKTTLRELFCGNDSKGFGNSGWNTSRLGPLPQRSSMTRLELCGKVSSSVSFGAGRFAPPNF